MSVCHPPFGCESRFWRRQRLPRSKRPPPPVRIYSPMRAARQQRSSEWSTASCSRTWPKDNVGPVATYGGDLLNLGAIVAISLHGHRYFFPYGKATDAGAPFTPDTLLEIGSCTKTFTTTLFALSINRNQIDPDTSAQKYMPEADTLRAPPSTPLALADF